MRKNKASLHIGVLILLATICLAGCWSNREINDLAIISVLGVDENEAGDLEVSALFIKAESLFSDTFVGGAGGQHKNKFLIHTSTGKDMFEAIGKLASAVSEEAYFGHVSTVIFGERAARNHMETSLDFFKRENDFRPNINMLVTKGQAADLLKLRPQFNSTLGSEINDLVNINEFASTQVIHDLMQFRKHVSSNTIDPVTGVVIPAEQLRVEVRSEDMGSENQNEPGAEEQANTEENEQENMETLSLYGTAAFKGGELVGFLDERQTRGLLSIQGELSNDVLVLDCGKNGPGAIGLLLQNSQSQLIPEISAQQLNMTLNIQVNAQLKEISCLDFNVDTDQIELLNRKLEKAIRQDVTSVLNVAQKQWETDIFGFGEAIYRKYPKQWDQMAPEWRNGLLKEMNIDLNVEANIIRYGQQKDPSKANESR
ncbi:Ger(x)C family spore germination protein [Alkalihalobacillus oceani]|uniref:Ger(x)C family spore germination protein n=1 Tax=Halalkalibacter oceani TaxID=1653776 RepID=UPI0020411CD6|nr:Ger(x)C family spore germination protein [Halalkalibacter oceani]MCM3760742.1 Ger(x)C family spore germination protein [Halalkalibacter oceani]